MKSNLSKIKGSKRILIASSMIVFSASTFSFLSYTNSANSICSCPNNYYQAQISNVAQCQPESNKSWFAWLKGDSRSAQFHYLDLLELLSGSDNNQSERSIHGQF